MRAASILREPLVVQGIGNKAEQTKRVEEMLDHVGLPPQEGQLVGIAQQRQHSVREWLPRLARWSTRLCRAGKLA